MQDKIILKTILKNDVNGWMELVEKYKKIIFTKILISMKLFKTEILLDKCDDIFFTVFKVIYRELKLKNYNEENLEKFILQITYSETKKFVTASVRSDSSTGFPMPEEISAAVRCKQSSNIIKVLNEENINKLKEKLNMLTIEEKIAIKFYYFYGNKLEVMANLLQTTSGAASKLVTEAEKKIITLLLQ